MNQEKIQYLYFAFLFLSACGVKETKDGNTMPVTENVVEKSNILTTFQPPIVNVYIENSGSMKGYLDSYSEFKDALTNYLTDIKIAGLSESFNLYFINKTTVKVGSDVKKYLEDLTKSSNAPTSDIALIFQQVLSNTHSNTISIFVSDCIFSPEKTKDASDYLLQQQSDIKAAVATHLQNFPNTSITVYQLNSKFSGTYYNRNDQQTILKNEMRPYYIWLVGDVEQISLLKEKIKDSQFKGGGVKHSYTLCPALNTEINYAILNTPKIGTFELDKKSPKNTLFDIEKADDGRGGQHFMFTVGINLGLYNTLLGNEYLVDTLSYDLQINNRPDKNYRIKLEPYANAGMGYTHTMQLATNKITTGDLSIVLKSNLPKWINETNDTIGLDIHKAMNKTFGVKYLVEGVYEAYILKGHTTYASMKFNLKK
jgi:hypothetical protein